MDIASPTLKVPFAVDDVTDDTVGGKARIVIPRALDSPVTTSSTVEPLRFARCIFESVVQYILLLVVLIARPYALESMSETRVSTPLPFQICPSYIAPSCVIYLAIGQVQRDSLWRT